MRKKRVLLVDDASEIRQALQQTLKNDFEVTSIATVPEALEVIASDVDLDILVTDFDLKSADRRDGLDIAQAMRAKHPGVPILMITGNDPGHPRIQELVAMPNTRILQKPFTKDLLRQALEPASGPWA